jgi:hypothetical protein
LVFFNRDRPHWSGYSRSEECTHNEEEGHGVPSIAKVKLREIELCAHDDSDGEQQNLRRQVAKKFEEGASGITEYHHFSWGTGRWDVAAQRASSGARSRLAGGASLWSGGLGVTVLAAFGVRSQNYPVRSIQTSWHRSDIKKSNIA